MEFKDLEFHVEGFSNHSQCRMDFDNGWGISIVIGPTTYGGNEGLYEIAVVHQGKLCYQSDITDDVIGWLNPEQVMEYVDRISKLEPVENCVHRNTNWD